MTTTDHQPPSGDYQPPSGPYVPPPMPPITHRAQRSTAAMIIGAVILVTGLLTAVSGGVLLALFGFGNTLGSGGHVVTTPTAAIVADLGAIKSTNEVAFLAGSPTIHVTADSSGGAPVFVGIGPADAVDAYLANVAVDRVTDVQLSPFQLGTERHQGSATVRAPADQNFWVASAQSGTGADLSWPIQNGQYRMVIMNADGTAEVHTLASIGVSLPNSSALWFLVIGVGVAFTIGGAALMALGARRPLAAV